MALRSAAAMLESEVNTGRVSSIMLSDKNPISCAGSAAAAQHGPAGSSAPNNALLAVENEG
eukprot:scaffold77763_cov24-Attheya_sp.AAC.1